MGDHLNHSRSKTIVIVEDEILVRDLVVCELQDAGYAVAEFDTADSALLYLQENGNRTALVLTDVQMPGKLNGLQLADIVGRAWPEVPGLVTSGGSLVDPRRLPPGAKFLRKPWRLAEMLAYVDALTGAARALA